MDKISYTVAAAMAALAGQAATLWWIVIALVVVLALLAIRAVVHMDREHDRLYMEHFAALPHQRTTFVA